MLGGILADCLAGNKCFIACHSTGLRGGHVVPITEWLHFKKQRAAKPRSPTCQATVRLIDFTTSKDRAEFKLQLQNPRPCTRRISGTQDSCKDYSGGQDGWVRDFAFHSSGETCSSACGITDFQIAAGSTTPSVGFRAGSLISGR